MDYKDYYKTLGVEKTATQKEIKSRFRKLARKYHPDLNKDEGAEDEFKKINEAYEVLGDTEKRAAYDQLGANFQHGQDFTPPPNWESGYQFSGDFQTGADSFYKGGAGYKGGTRGPEDFSDFFETLFGQAYREQQKAGGGASAFQAAHTAQQPDSHAKIVIDIEDSFAGTTKPLALKIPTLDPDGQLTLKERQLNVTIPKGIQEGQHIRLKGQGQAVSGQETASDLYLEIAFAPHRLYHAEGQDLFLTLPVAPWEAALGQKVKVPTPGGAVQMALPQNAQQGQKIRLKGRGLPGKTAGDLYVILQIVLPPATSDKAKELYETMAKEMNFNPRASLGV